MVRPIKSYINVDIDLADVVASLDDYQIREIADSINYASTSRDEVIVAVNQIRSGRHADAVTTLEREFLPKWKDRADCEAAYRMAMSTAARIAA